VVIARGYGRFYVTRLAGSQLALYATVLPLEAERALSRDVRRSGASELRRVLVSADERLARPHGRRHQTPPHRRVRGDRERPARTWPHARAGDSASPARALRIRAWCEPLAMDGPRPVTIEITKPVIGRYAGADDQHVALLRLSGQFDIWDDDGRHTRTAARGRLSHGQAGRRVE